jgi:predicted membrane protein
MEPERPDKGDAFARASRDRIVRDSEAHGSPWTNDSPELRVTPRLVIGLTIMLAGLALALDSLGLVDATAVLRFWPLALIAIGIAKWLSPGRSSGAIVWVVAGMGFLLVTMGRMSFAGVWALVIFFVGANIAWRALRPPSVAADVTTGVDLVQFMGGTKTNVTTEFKGGQAMAVMGGVEIDFRHAILSEGNEAVLDNFAFWGGIVIRVPEEWEVISRGSAFLGGFVNSTRSAPGATRRLVVTGTAIMGGVEVKN